MKNKSGFSSIILLSFLSSAGQNTGITIDQMKRMHYETMGDNYLPNAYNNKKVSPAYKFKKNYAAPKRMGSSIFTIQVNVDSSGQNILGDAANEPGIAVNPLDENIIVIGWRQFDNVNSNFRQAGWSYTSNAGQTWTFPGTIEQGVFRSDPVLDYDAAGNFYYNSLSLDNAGTFICKVFKSANGGVLWDNGANAKGGDKQWMTIDRTTGLGSGNIYAFWNSSFSSCSPGFFTRSADGGSSFEECTVAEGNPYWGTMAVGNAGELYICGASPSSTNLVVTKSLNAQAPASLITWDPPVSVFMDGSMNAFTNVNPDGLTGQVNIDVDRSNGPGRDNVYVLASMARISNSDPCDVMFAKSVDAGLTWSSPIRINDDPLEENNIQWFGTMSVAPNGRIDAVWLDTRDNSGTDISALYYSYSTDQGDTWSANEIMSDIFDPHTGYPNQKKMGDYFDMVSDNLGAHLAWTNTFNGEEDIYYSYITPDITVGENKILNNSEFSIFPNPTSGTFVILSEAGKSYIEIYTVMGEKVYSATISKTISEIDISSQPAGVYLMKIMRPDGNIIVKKIIRK